jgi:hypothetical protein
LDETGDRKAARDLITIKQPQKLLMQISGLNAFSVKMLE